MAFDIVKQNLSAKAEAGYEFEVKLPDGTDTGFFITVRGSLSPVVKTYGKKVFKQMQLKDAQAKRKGKTVDFDLNEAEDLAVESAVTRIINWRGLEEDGVEVPYNEDNAARIMRELEWVRAQVLEEADIAANFI